MDEKNYVPTENVNSVDYAVTSKTGISENSAGFNPTEKSRWNFYF